MERPLFLDLSGALLVFLVWIFGRQLLLLAPIPPAAATAALLAAGALLIAGWVWPWPGPLAEERRARAPMRSLGAHWPWAILTALAAAVLLLVFTELYARFVPPPPPDDVYLANFARPLGWLPSLVAVGLVGPLLGESLFRGWMQGRLTRTFGPEVAIINAAALYAVANLYVWLVPTLFLLGLLCGYSVYLTRSVWSAVLISAAFGSLGILADLWLPDLDFSTGPLGGDRGLVLGGALIAVTAAVSVYTLGRQRVLHDAEPEEPARGDAPPHA